MVKETFGFSSGTVMPRKMFLEITGPDRLHVTADDMPLGADIILTEDSFTFTPYYIWGKYRGRYWRMKIDPDVVSYYFSSATYFTNFFNNSEFA